METKDFVIKLLEYNDITSYVITDNYLYLNFEAAEWQSGWDLRLDIRLSNLQGILECYCCKTLKQPPKTFRDWWESIANEDDKAGFILNALGKDSNLIYDKSTTFRNDADYLFSIPKSWDIDKQIEAYKTIGKVYNKKEEL